ncbi:MAG: ABC transporter transmembrane domain-containing protein, partial [Steroidobacteraceae bacterium]
MSGPPKAMPKRLPPAGQPARGPGWMNAGQPAEKSLNFWPSTRRLIARLAPDRLRVASVLVLAVVSVALSVIGPMLIGRATDIIFSGVMSKMLAAGTTARQAVAAARASGNANLADMLAHMHLAPGTSIDFSALGVILLLVVAVYLGSSLFSWAQGYILNDVVQATVLRLRAEVEDKINRLPLSYFDRQPRGELLSRVTNDISNISQSLQQTMSQLLTSLLTVIGVVGMMFVISPLLALIALITIPL